MHTIKNIYLVASRELVMLFKSVSFYIVIALFMVLNGLFFSAIIDSGAGGNLSYLFRNEALVLMFIVPAITMGAFVREKRSGTIDLLITTSLRPFEFTTGKFIAYGLVGGLLILVTLQYPFWLSIFTEIDGGRVVAGSLGLFFFTLAAAGIGLFVSSVANHQIMASFGAFFLILILWCAESVTRLMSLDLSSHLRNLSFFERFIPFASGMLDYADGCFFLSIFICFLTFSHFVIKRRYGGERKEWVKALLIVISLFFIQTICDRNMGRVDLTREGLFSISEPMKALLSEIKSKVRVMVFISSNDPARTDVDGILREIHSLCPLLEYSLIDPNISSDLTKKLKITKARTVLFSNSTRAVKSYGCNEVQLLSGIRRLLRTTEKSICFLGGHGERDFLSPDGDGIRLYVESLAAAGLSVTPLKLDKVTQAIPEDCGAIVIAQPKTDLLERELELLNAFVDSGGGLLIFAEVTPGKNWEKLFSRYGLAFEDAVLIDPVSNIRGLATEPIISDFRNHPAVKTLERVALRGVRPLKLSGVEGVRKSPLFLSSGYSWGEKSLDETIPKFDDADMKGPLLLAVAAEKTIGWRNASEEMIGRIILIGDGDLPSNQSFNDLSNAELLLGSVEWVSGYGENVIMLPKGFLCRDLYLGAGQFNLLFLVSVIGVPVTALIASLIAWFFQR